MQCQISVSTAVVATIMLRAVDRSIIQFWTFLAKGHSTLNFPFINSLKIFKCATNRDSLLLATLRYIDWSKSGRETSGPSKMVIPIYFKLIFIQNLRVFRMFLLIFNYEFKKTLAPLFYLRDHLYITSTKELGR